MRYLLTETAHPAYHILRSVSVDWECYPQIAGTIYHCGSAVLTVQSLIRVARQTLIVMMAWCRYGRPARCVLDRPTDMQITGYRRPYSAKYKVRLLGADSNYVSNLVVFCITLTLYGHFPDLGIMTV